MKNSSLTLIMTKERMRVYGHMIFLRQNILLPPPIYLLG